MLEKPPSILELKSALILKWKVKNGKVKINLN